MNDKTILKMIKWRKIGPSNANSDVFKLIKKQ